MQHNSGQLVILFYHLVAEGLDRRTGLAPLLSALDRQDR